MVAAASLTLAAVHGLIWILDRRNLANLAFCVVAVSVAAIARVEFDLAGAASPEDYAQLVRGIHLPLFFFAAGIVFFIRLYFRTARDWLGWTVIALRGVVTAGNILGPSTASWHVLRLEQVPMLGELATTSGAAAVRPLQWLATTTAILLILYVLDAAIAFWRRPEREARRKAAMLGGGMVAFLLTATVQTQLVIWGVVRMPVMISPPFLIMLVAMTFELCRDIVASARIEREAREARVQLAHLSRVALLGELSGGIAHELNQPLAAILSNAQAGLRLLDRNDPDYGEIREILRDVVADDKRAGEVIQRLRAMFKRAETQFAPIEVNTLVYDVLDIVRGDLVTRGIELERELASGLPLVSGDHIELQQVMLNLVVNACEAMSSATNGAARRLTVRTRLVDHAAVVIEVDDTGPGFTTEQHERMFEPFYTTKSQGLGLGLSISRTIIRAHAGQLDGTGLPGGGARFHIHLPTLSAGAAG